jgi:hypothetical protein
MTQDPWELEHETTQPPKLEFKPKAHLVLEGSADFEWGVVKDCHGNINIIPGEDAEIVGTWNKYATGPDGKLTFWVSLQTSIEALQDRATQLYAELAAGRENAMAKMKEVKPTKRTTRAKAQPKAGPTLEEKKKHDEFEALRNRLKGG